MGSTSEDIFDQWGPRHLTVIDWTNEDHKRSVVASLVKGAYVIERDLKAGREGPEALAPPWWESFHFRLVDQVTDYGDFITFAAVIEYEPGLETEHSPRYVIAFRGTLRNVRDLKHDVRVFLNTLHHTYRSCKALQAVRETVANASEPHSKIWLAGHSLGSSLATIAGREMALEGIFLTAFLFNPPFPSAPIERVRPQSPEHGIRALIIDTRYAYKTGIKHGIRTARSVVKAGLAYAIKDKGQREAQEARFVDLSEWVPDLFVNQRDPICSEYKAYFEHRDVMEKMGMGKIENLVTQYSIRGLFTDVIIRNDLHEPMHHIPSARVIANVGSGGTLGDAHSLSQWWKPDLDLDSKLYEYVEISDPVDSE